MDEAGNMFPASLLLNGRESRLPNLLLIPADRFGLFLPADLSLGLCVFLAPHITDQALLNAPTLERPHRRIKVLQSLLGIISWLDIHGQTALVNVPSVTIKVSSHWGSPEV
jgi:hypothetical protein